MIGNISRKQFALGVLGLVVAGVLLAPFASAQAQTYGYSYDSYRASLIAQLNYLKQELARLQDEVRRRQAYQYNYGCTYCTDYTYPYRYRNDVDEIDVDFVGRVAQVRVEYDDGDEEFFSYYADTRYEVAQALSRELRLSAVTVERMIDEVRFGRHDDIDDIDVYFDGDDADVIVRFEDNDRDRFTLYSVDRDRTDVIEEIADRYNERESTIRRVVDFHTRSRSSRDDIRDIDVEFVRDDARVVVRFRDGDIDRFTLYNVDHDEDDVIEEIADRYNEDEDDIEDVIDFDDDRRDIRAINVNFVRDDAYVIIEFWNSRRDYVTIRNVDYDEDEVIEFLARRYDVDEDDIEDMTDFDY